MKLIINLSKIILILFILLMGSVMCVALSPNIYNNSKICRLKEEIEINNYKNISNVEDIFLIENCDKTVIFIKIHDSINEDNIKGIIQEFIYKKIIFNDNLLFEIYIKNSSILCICVIKEDESYDIVFGSF